MKKLLLLILLVITLSGCTKIDNNNDNYLDIVNNVLQHKNNITNRASTGYKYFLPKGTRLVYDKEFNQKIKYLNNDIYLYVDVVSYFYKNSLNYDSSYLKENYYFKEINNFDKVGFISITDKGNDKYFLKIVYNYAKIEVYTNKNDLAKTINICSIILNNITFNDNMIKNMLDTSSLSNEIVYEIDKPENASSKYSQYLEEYVQEEKQEKLPDDE